MSLEVEDAAAVLDRGLADRLREVTLAGAGRSEEKRVFVLGDEAGGREVEDERAIELAIEIEIEGVERLGGIAKVRLGASPREQAILAPDELVGDERGDEIEWGLALGLGLPEAGVQDVGHAGETELAERAVEFGEGHSGVSCSAVWRSM